MYPRVCLTKAGMEYAGRSGDGWLSHLLPVTFNSDGAADVLTAARISGGLFIRTGMTADRSMATDTAANLLAMLSEMDVGDTYVFRVVVTTAFALTITGGTGVTVSRGVVPVFTSATGVGGGKFFLLTKTGAATCTVDGI